ncbi:hypothetical protein VCR3J2_50090 [Vibrio coralliirubri]|nr:hypothetical protein VCR3J2_50090 [Vibrio coralliirubri]
MKIECYFIKKIGCLKVGLILLLRVLWVWLSFTTNRRYFEYRVYGFEELFQWQRVTLRGNNKKAAVRSGFGRERSEVLLVR